MSKKMTKKEYREAIRKILMKGLRDCIDNEDFERLLDRVMAVPFPKEGNPYVGMSTREDVDFGKGKKEDNKGR